MNLQNDAGVTSSTQIGLTWEEGAANGGSAVIDYRVSYDQGYDVFVVLQENVLGTSYAVTGLTPDTYYKFKVEARNSFGYSGYSST